MSYIQNYEMFERLNLQKYSNMLRSRKSIKNKTFSHRLYLLCTIRQIGVGYVSVERVDVCRICLFLFISISLFV